MIDERIIVGIVTRVGTRGSIRFASIRPLAVSSADHQAWECDLTDGARPRELFPNAGSVSWLHPDTEVGTLWQFTVQEQSSYDPTDPIHDKYMVAQKSARRVFPVLDLKELGGDQIGRQTLARLGIRFPSDTTTEFIVRTEQNLWSANSIQLKPRDDSPDAFVMPLNSDEMTRWVEWTPNLGPFELICDRRCIHTPFRWSLLPPNTKPEGPIRLRDWSSDHKVLQHLLRTLRKFDANYAEKMGLTTASISEISRVLSSGSVGISNPGLEKARLQRVTEYIESLASAEEVATLAMTVICDSPVAKSIEEQKEKILEEARDAAREQIDKEYAAERQKVEEQQERGNELAQTNSQLASDYNALQSKRREQLHNLESSVASRLAEVLENAEEIVTSAALIRAISGQRGITGTALSPVDESDSTRNRRSAPDSLKDSLNNLRAALNRRDAPFLLSTPLLAGFLSGLMPVVSGTRGYSALSAFADCFTGGKMNWIPVSPGWLDPSDFIGKPSGEDRNHQCCLLETLQNATRSDSVSLVVLDGINVAPCEAFLLPLLACQSDSTYKSHSARSLPVADSRDISVTRVVWPRNVLLAATMSPAGQFPVHSAVWQSSLTLFVDAVKSPELDVSKGMHPDARRATESEDVFSVSTETWDRWRENGRHESVADCAQLLDQYGNERRLDHSVRDAALRYFAAASCLQSPAQALLETVAFVLLPHFVGDQQTDTNLVESMIPQYYDSQYAVSEFLRINR